MRTATLVTVYNSQEAALIKGNLANHGISSFIANDTSSTLLPYLNGMMGSGIHVMVFEQDMQKAIEIISPQEVIRKLCPNCKSENIKYGLGKSKSKILLIIISLLAWIPFTNISNTYHCADCNYEFK